MLPDFPKIKKDLMRRINKYLQHKVQEDSFLSQIRTERHFEGNRMATHTEDGGFEESYYELFSGDLELKKEDIITKGAAALVEKVDNVAEELKKQKAELVFKKMQEITKKTGNIVNGKGKPLTPDFLLKSLEKMWIDFDKSGKPIMPQLVVSPQMGATLREKIPEWEKDLEHKKKFDELIEKKRKEWNDRESHRKLVD